MSGVTAPRIAFFSGSRAEFGLVSPILRQVASSGQFECELWVTSHEGHDPTPHLINLPSTVHLEEVEIPSLDGAPKTEAQAVVACLDRFLPLLDDRAPDLVFCYADRFETYAFGLAAFLLGVPIGHIEGGDVTTGGALDDQFRHSLTKFAALHFTTNPQSAAVVAQLGEEPHRIFDVGSPTVDIALSTELLKPEQIAHELMIDLARPTILFTLHPAGQSSSELSEVFEALEQLSLRGVQIIVTAPNVDRGFNEIASRLEQFAPPPGSAVVFRKSLGHILYFSLLREMGRDGAITGACVGNSSSVVKDTPVFGAPGVLIGRRQDGRLRSENVLRVEESASQIQEAVWMSLFDEKFRHRAMSASNPYGDGNTARNITKVLTNQSFPIQTAKGFVIQARSL